MRKKTSKRLATLCKYTGLGAAIAAELMICFWLGIGVILAIGLVYSLNHCVKAASEAATTKMEVNYVTTKTEGVASEAATTKTEAPGAVSDVTTTQWKNHKQ